MWDAMMRRVAVGMPMGRNLLGSFVSLWRQKRYVSVKNFLAMVGIWPW